jgi:hypothetical protein
MGIKKKKATGTLLGCLKKGGRERTYGLYKG